MKKIIHIILTAIVLLASELGARAACTFNVTNSGSTFTITRSGNTSVAESVSYRTVSLSAIEGQHFTAKSGMLDFAADETVKTVTVTESTPGTEVYKYQEANSRSYRFEVLDKDGYVLAAVDRSITTGTRITATNAFGNKDLTINSETITVTDNGYAQAYHSVTVSSYYSAAAPKNYLTAAGAELRMTVTFDAREKDDGYQYVQIYANTSTNNVDSGASDGDPGDINYSLYMAGFTIDGNVSSTYYTYTFPLTSYGSGCGAKAHPWSGNSNGNLVQQYFNSGCRASDGRLVIPTDLSSLYVRFDASGNLGDTWYVQNLKAHIQAVDITAPTVLNNYKVSGGSHQRGNKIYVSVPFSEIVKVTGTPTLISSWGTLSYVAGDGTNVLTFCGEIRSDAVGTFSVTGHRGTIKDLSGNSLSSSISRSFSLSLDESYAWSTGDFNVLSNGAFEIATRLDLRHLALLVNGQHDDCTGKTFRQTQDIACDNTYIPIGYYHSSSDYGYFCGTYDGGGHTVSGIVVNRTGSGYEDGSVGLFGRTSQGTIQNVVLADCSFAGHEDVGGIVGRSLEGTVLNCRVESTVTINAGSNAAWCHGGIVGSSLRASIIGCACAANVSNNGRTGASRYGGIAGYDENGTIKDCFYAGTTITAESDCGAIAGYEYGDSPTYVNNYYTATGLGGVGGSDVDGARLARTLTLGNKVAISGSETSYNVSGIASIGDCALRSDSVLYSGESQVIPLRYTGTSVGYIISYSATDDEDNDITSTVINGSTLTMPSCNVNITVTATPNTISYIDADGTEKKSNCTDIVSGITQYGNEDNWVGWYCVSSDVSFDQRITFLDKEVRIILCDGKTLTVNSSLYEGLLVRNSSGRPLKIYCQSGGTGALTVTAPGGSVSALRSGELEINGGIITATSTQNGTSAISADNGEMTIRGGSITANGTSRGLRARSDITIEGGTLNVSSSQYALVSDLGNISILGGNVTATGSSGIISGYISSSGYKSIILGYSGPSDSITAEKYVCATISVADGQTLTDGTSTYSGTLTDEEKTAIAGKTLRPSGAPSVELTLVQGVKDGTTAYWGTFYHSFQRYALPSGAAAYTMGSDYKLYRLGVDGRVIPAGVAVVVISPSPDVTVSIDNGSSEVADNAFGGNILQGSDSAVSSFPGTPYVLSINGEAVGFRRFTGSSIPGGRAYYVVE